MAADGGERLYQQNHCGVYRSTDGGAPVGGDHAAACRREFGFPMAAHPRDPHDRLDHPADRARAGPADARRRARPSGARTTAATPGSGRGDGLPQENAFVGVLREAMAVDQLDPVGVYFGTSTGQLYGIRDEGRTWRRIADNLPPIWSVEALVLD